MKKIGILTFHYADNYGAVLQAYALRKTINRLSGCTAEIINYIPKDYIYYPYESGEIGLQKIKSKRNLFNKFLEVNCGIVEDVCHEINEEQYDYICVGSDQVWNTELSENSELGYFLPKILNKKKCFSYAASIGTKPSKVDYSLFKKYISDFKAVALREADQYQESLRIYSGIESVQTLDPTLLLKKEDLLNIIPKRDNNDRKFIFFFWYALDDNLPKCAEFINILSIKYNLSVKHTIVNLPKYMLVKDEECVFYEGIEDFLWYLQNAEFVVTNSFHGLALSILLKKQFFLFISDLRRERIDNLVNLLGLENRIVDSLVLSNTIDDGIGYDKVNKKLDKEREKSINYLKKVLEVDE